MSSQTNISSDRLRINWTPTMERYFIDLMLDQVHRGNRMGHTFSKQTWNDMLIMVNAKFGSQYDINILKSRYTNLWKQFNDIRNLLDQDGFSWDNARKMVIAESNIWDSFIRAHPDVQSYRNRSLMNFNDLCLIYAHTTADGRYSISSHDLDFDDDMIGLSIGVVTNGLAPVNKECSRADWTLAMDQYLVKLLVDQVRQGSRINGGFKKQAWRDMISFFNVEFGYQYGKSFLKHRFRKLKMYYNDLRDLLETRGFSWDEKRQMVVADVGVWDKYVKANPDACAYKNRTLLNFLDLCLIYGDTISNGQCNRMHQLEYFECGILPQETDGQDIPCLADSDSSSTQWSPEMDSYFIDLMLEVMRKVKNIDYNNDLVWTNMVASFQERFGFLFNQNFFKRRCKSLEKEYYDLKNILEQEGFWWDETQHIVTAYDDTWAVNVKEYPHAKSYMSGPTLSYNDLCLIYGNSISDEGQWHNQLGQDIAYHGKRARANNDSYHWRSDWTPQMDRHFIDLMLYQVRTGSMVDQNFSKLAWNDLVSKFSAEFGSQHDEDVLKSRFLNLRKRFHDMKFLLDQDGFVWDELQQMIIAEDVLWDAYTQEYPYARSYHNRALPNFNDLFLIFGNDNTTKNHQYLFNSVDADDSYPGENIGEAEEHFIADSGQARIQWTNEMDNYLVDLMLEQVHRGNKTGSTFTDHAWTWMIVSLNRTFGLTCNKEVLEDRYVSLMKEYKDAKHMVLEKNVTWNGIHESVTTYDEVWETCSKESVGDDKCTGRIIDRYEDLSLIYDDEFLDERSSNFSIKEKVNDSARRICRSDGVKEYKPRDRECEMLNQRKKLKSATPSTSAGNKKIKRIKEEMQEVVSKKASLVKNLVDNADNKDCSSIETIVAALQSVPEMDDELFLEACKVLEDERKAKMFIAMDVMARREWLSKKLRQ